MFPRPTSSYSYLFILDWESWGGLERCCLISHQYLVLSSSACVALCCVFPLNPVFLRILSIPAAQHERMDGIILSRRFPPYWQLSLTHSTCKWISRLFLFLILPICETNIIWTYDPILCPAMAWLALAYVFVLFCVLCKVHSVFRCGVFEWEIMCIWIRIGIYFLFPVSMTQKRAKKTCA